MFVVKMGAFPIKKKIFRIIVCPELYLPEYSFRRLFVNFIAEYCKFIKRRKKIGLFFENKKTRTYIC